MRLNFVLGLAGALALCAVVKPAAAQERLDSSIRAWADIVIYSGEVFGPGIEATAVTPVLRAELELSSWQLGLDLPMAFGDVEIGGQLIANEGSGAAARLANPTLHFDYVLEPKPLRLSLGVALAIPTTGDDDDPDSRGASLLAAAAIFARGWMNQWWYLEDTWSLLAPMAVDFVSDDYELGLEGALAWFLPRGEGSENEGAFQISGRAGAVAGPALLGVRLQGVLFTDMGVADDDFQSSVELFAELRALPILWLGAGFLFALDEPLGFGDGLGMWGLRVSGGVSF